MNKKFLAFGTAAVLAVILLSLLLSRASEKPGAAQEAIAAQPSFGQLPSEFSQPSQAQQAKPLGNIPHQTVKSDATINAIIDSSQKLDSGNLVVKFHHTSSKEEPVSVIGAVRYQLSKPTAQPNEEITLTVFDWSTEYFEIKVGKESSVMGFGRKVW